MITIDGIRKLLVWKMLGKPLPDGWEKDVVEYIKRREELNEMLKKQEDKKEMLVAMENLLNEAKSIAKMLGVGIYEG